MGDEDTPTSNRHGLVQVHTRLHATRREMGMGWVVAGLDFMRGGLSDQGEGLGRVQLEGTMTTVIPLGCYSVL